MQWPVLLTLRIEHQSMLARYRDRKAAHTLRRQAADIALFETFLNQAAESVSAVNMAHDLAAWSGVTPGLIEAFNLWQRSQGYAIGSINIRLSSVKKYSELAFSARYMSSEAYSLIRGSQHFYPKSPLRICVTDGVRSAFPVKR